jgi:2-succinyl-6-hydroxy-2,4-cyclohexadiene-1-carboxylate synthase
MTPLALIHGFTGEPSNWEPAVRRLGGLRIPLSPWGHGVSNEREERVKSWSDELIRLRALLPPEPVHLAGYSLGARLALGIALAFPNQVARLTLVSGHTGLGSERERDERRQADARWIRLLETEGIEAFVSGWEAQPLFASQSRLPAAVLAKRRSERLAHDAKRLARSLRLTGLAEMPDYGSELARLAMPVDVIVGELDAKFLAIGRATCERIPAGRLVVAPGVGHDLLLESPDLVALVLEDGPRSPEDTP